MLVAKVNPRILSAFWAEKHMVPKDIEIALAHLPILEALLPPAIVSKKPKFIHMMGGPGYGKSSVVNGLFEHTQIRQQMFCLSFDRVMEALPGYQQDLEEKGNVDAFNRWELPTLVLGYALLGSMLERKVSGIFDHSASDRRHVHLLLDIKRRGYDVKMISLDVSLETALHRVRERRVKPGARYTSDEMVMERHGIITQLAPTYRRHFDVTNFNNEKPLDIRALDIIIASISGNDQARV